MKYDRGDLLLNIRFGAWHLQVSSLATPGWRLRHLIPTLYFNKHHAWMIEYWPRPRQWFGEFRDKINPWDKSPTAWRWFKVYSLFGWSP